MAKTKKKKTVVTLPAFMDEVKFIEEAQVSDVFASALKVWRIEEPNVIFIENQ